MKIDEWARNLYRIYMAPYSIVWLWIEWPSLKNGWPSNNIIYGYIYAIHVIYNLCYLMNVHLLISMVKDCTLYHDRLAKQMMLYMCKILTNPSRCYARNESPRSWSNLRAPLLITQHTYMNHTGTLACHHLNSMLGDTVWDTQGDELNCLKYTYIPECLCCTCN